MPPTSTGAAVPRVLIGLPCVHVTGASVADAEFQLQNPSTNGSDVCFQITENPLVIMKRQSLHVKDNAIYDQFTKQQVIWTHGYGATDIYVTRNEWGALLRSDLYIPTSWTAQAMYAREEANRLITRLVPRSQKDPRSRVCWVQGLGPWWILDLARPFCRGTLETQDLKIVICRKTLETQDLKMLICSETLEPRTLKFGYVTKPWKPRT